MFLVVALHAQGCASINIQEERLHVLGHCRATGCAVRAEPDLVPV